MVFCRNFSKKKKLQGEGCRRHMGRQGCLPDIWPQQIISGPHSTHWQQNPCTALTSSEKDVSSLTFLLPSSWHSLFQQGSIPDFSAVTFLQFWTFLKGLQEMPDFILSPLRTIPFTSAFFLVVIFPFEGSPPHTQSGEWTLQPNG